MFTGLVEATGTFRLRGGRPVARAIIETNLGEAEPLVLGESIAVDGVCLTVDRIVAGGFEADVSSESLDATSLGALSAGARVHLERATKLGGRMGGHTVLGHVDAVGKVHARSHVGAAILLGVEIPSALGRFVAPKGSIAIDGVSLTVNAVSDHPDATRFELMLVPHTIAHTNLGSLRPGGAVNIEVDVLARYVARDASWQHTANGAGRGETEQQLGHDERLLHKLRSGGFLG